MTFVAPPGYEPVYNPTIPYLGPIYGGLREDSSINIQGSIPENITRFEINLRCDPSESSDITLHFNPRFDGWDKVVVFNTCEKGSWGSEDNIWSMPFCKGERFEMVILVTSQGYQIRVNNKDFHTFPHRMPVERVGGIQITGDVVVETINVIGGGMCGGMCGGMGGGDGMGGDYSRDNMGGGYPGGDMEGEYPGGMDD